MNDDDYKGLAITSGDHKVRLKWHKLLRRLDGPVFDGDVLRLGSELGASMEIDMRVRADGGFALLHDDVLEGETTGSGPVSDASMATLRSLRMRHGGQITLSEDLATMLGTAHPHALLQFDMKDDFEAIGERGIAHLAEHFADKGGQIIISAGDNDLIMAVKDRLPGIRRGIDPTERFLHLWQHEGLVAAEASLLEDLSGETEPEMIYLQWKMILNAKAQGLDLIALCHDHGCTVDAWTWNPRNPAGGFLPEEWQDIRDLVALRPDQITTDECQWLERRWVEQNTANP